MQQTQVIAAAAAGVAAEGLSPKDSRAEAENAAQLSVALVENAIVILMLVEDHLRLQSKLSCASRTTDGSASSLSLVPPLNNRSNSSTTTSRSSLSDNAGLPLDVCICITLHHISHIQPCMHTMGLFIFMDDSYRFSNVFHIVRHPWNSFMILLYFICVLFIFIFFIYISMCY